MNIDKAIETIEAGIPDAATRLYSTQLSGEDLVARGLRRRGPGPTYLMWTLEVLSAGNVYASFVDRRLTLSIKKALAWRGVVSRRKTSAQEPNTGG